MHYAISPTSLTIICTYRCTAACAQCCFESNPRLRGQLDGRAMVQRISEAAAAFPDLRLVVFSGGEPTLLKQDLVDAVAHCTSLGLLSRIVSNGSWAKRLERAQEKCAALRAAGLSELNLSTGRDHQAWVAQDSVVNAAEAAVDAGVRVLVTIESDTDESHCLASLQSSPRIARLAEHPLFSVQANFWMPFHRDAPARKQAPDLAQLRKGCGQVFNNVVVTPRDTASACCGLTFEHIPEMHLGACSGDNLGDLYRRQGDDFLKYWLKVDGPYSIIERLLGEAAAGKLEGVVHHCEACALLHRDPDVRAELARRYAEFIPDVMTRHAIGAALQPHLGNAMEAS